MSAVRRRAAAYWLSAPALAVYALFLVVPIASIALISFQNFEFYGGIQPGITLKNYREIFTDSYYWEVFGRTFWIALVVTALCAVLGTFEAIVLHRMANPWKSIFLLVVLGPLLISVVVRTLGWALLFGSTGLANKALLALGLVAEPIAFMYSVTGVVVALTHVLVPFVVISVWASLQRIDPAVERAAVSLGAGRFTVFRRITLPLILPGIVSGWLLAFITSFDELTMSVFIASPSTTTLPVRMFLHIQDTIDPLVAAVSALMIAGTVLLMGALDRLVGLERLFVGKGKH